jgi:hypothetical protein
VDFAVTIIIDWPPYVRRPYAARIAPAARCHFAVAASGGARP